MNAFSRSKRYISMDRVKEMHEEKYQRQLIVEKKEEKRQNKIQEIVKSEAMDWRSELAEGMTTAGMGMVSLEPNSDHITPEDDINANAYGGQFPADGSLSNGIWTMQNAPDPGNGGITISLRADLSRSDTISTQVYFNNATIDPAYGMDLILNGPIGSRLQQVVPLSVPGSGTGSANPLISIDPKLRIKDVILSYSVIGNGGDGGREIGNNSIRITSTVPFRRSPMTLFVPLDDPEANSFVRSGLDNLSAAERRKRLQQIMKGSRDYMKQQLGMDWSTDIADTGVVTPWDQANPGGIEVAQAEYPEDDWNQEDEMLLKWLQQGGLPGADTEKDIERLLQRKSRYGGGFSRKTQDLQVAHYEPDGEVISEKKKLKSVHDALKKNVGFPENPPPKMINGFHPDLVTGDGAAKRFNKLDPASAKAMPKTAYPQIDKKVKAAAKKPK